MQTYLISVLKRLLPVFGSVAATVLLLEAILHFLYFAGLFPDYPAMMTRLEKLQYAHAVSQTVFNDNVPRNGPGFGTFTQRGIPRQLIEFSTDGMRLDEFDGPARCTVGIFGDSFAEARQVGQNEDLSSLTESVLRSAGYDVNFQNFARGGDGTTVQYLRYGQLVEDGYEFDLVFLFFYPGNDVANNSQVLNGGETGRYPYYVVEAGELKREDSQGTLLKSGRLRFLREFLAKYSHLSNLFKAAQTELVTIPNILSSSHGAFDPNPDQTWGDAWLVTEKVLEAWSHDATRRGTTFVLVMLTTMGQLTESISEVAGLDEAYPNGRMKNFTSSLDIEYIDLLPLAKKYISDNNLGYPYLSWQHDGHYSQVGHRFVSDNLVRYFLDNGQQCRGG